jgi:hypothetical protein
MDIKDRYTGKVLFAINADLSDAGLRHADLSDANLSHADLSHADLRYADLSYAKYAGITISKVSVFTGLYTYICMPIIAKGGSRYIVMGCYFRTVDEWAADFWNNPSEFPNDNSLKSRQRWFAYQTCLRWFEMQDNTIGG